jgi:hypothetical protein
MVMVSNSWSEIAVPLASTAAIVCAAVTLSPLVKNQSRRPNGGAGVPSGRERWVGSGVLQDCQS